MPGSEVSRRQFLRTAGAGAVGVAAAAAFPKLSGPKGAALFDESIDHAKIAGSLELWDVTAAPSIPGEQAQSAFYGKYLPQRFPKLNLNYTLLGYSDEATKITVAWRASSKPDIARLTIASASQFVDEGLCAEITEEQLGIPLNQFHPVALESVRKNGAGKGPIYGVPTNNEAMILLYNKSLFQQAGLDPSKPPSTWAELMSMAKTITQKTGSYGYGMCAQINNGNTPYRFMPQCWANGGEIFDELSHYPTWKKIGIGNSGTVETLSQWNQMYNIDHSVQPSALGDNENNVETLFLDGKVAMCIDHPSFARQVVVQAPNLDMGAAMLPAGSLRKAVVQGGWSLHIRKDSRNKAAALAVIKQYVGNSYWNCRLGILGGSAPATISARASKWNDYFAHKMEPYYQMSLNMLPYAVSVPLVSSSTQIWNILLPTMIQTVLTGKQSPKDAAASAASQIKSMI